MGFSSEVIAEWEASRRRPATGWREAVIAGYHQVSRQMVTIELRDGAGWTGQARFSLRIRDLWSDRLRSFVNAAMKLDPAAHQGPSFQQANARTFKSLIGLRVRVCTFVDRHDAEVLDWEPAGGLVSPAPRRVVDDFPFPT